MLTIINLFPLDALKNGILNSNHVTDVEEKKSKIVKRTFNK